MDFYLTCTVLLDMVKPGVLLQAHFPALYIFIANMLQCFAKRALALLVPLFVAYLEVESAAHLILQLLLVAELLVPLGLLGGLAGDPPLAAPVSPDVGQLVADCFPNSGHSC